MSSSIISEARSAFHRELVASGTLSVSKEGIASNADRSQKTSRLIAASLAQQLGAAKAEKSPGQSAGARFEIATATFLRSCIVANPVFDNGEWRVENVGSSRNRDHVANYYPYRNLDELGAVVAETPNLQAVLGNSYVVSPDVLVTRSPLSDEEINDMDQIVDLESGLMSPVRRDNQNRRRKLDATPESFASIVHAVVSCKWTMRSDRAQNTRSEALNLIRNRKGRAPHIIAVTAEPTPSRIASLALGTGDIDCVYHAALPELENAVQDSGNDEADSLLKILIEGDRLRDISDLPLDLML